MVELFLIGIPFISYLTFSILEMVSFKLTDKNRIVLNKDIRRLYKEKIEIKKGA